jgi:prenyl protein peptidase
LPSKSFWKTILPLIATVVLFAGPLCQWLLDDPEDWYPTQVASSLRRGARMSLVWWRNYIVAPIAEEWAFRACMCPLLRAAGFTFFSCVVIPPLLFGIAHAHHVFLILRDRAGGTKILSVVVTILFQVFYTTVFGMMASFYFLTSGSIFGSILSHAFCNMMGFPDFVEAKNSDRKWLLLCVYVGGVVGYYFLMSSMYDIELMLEFMDSSSPISNLFPAVFGARLKGAQAI